jgi:hypothetical protein
LKTWKLYGLIILFTLPGGCIEPFTPEIKNYEDLLVVEALITDEASTQFVRLTRSHPLDTSIINFERGASILLTNSTGNDYIFRESTQGLYSPDPGSFTPVPGEIYTLFITTFDGRTYSSDPVTMKITPPIQDLYFERMSVPSDETGDLDDGLQILINTGTESSDPGYYKFDWEETYELETPYYSFFDYDYQTQEIIERKDNINSCWSGSISTNLNIASSENLSNDIIYEHPIRFIPFRDPMLKIRYSILVKQSSLSEESFRFWQNLKESNESTGSLYDAQPFQVIGNIKNVNDPSEPVLGYFDMTTVSSKRIFISGREDIPEGVRVPSPYANCLIGADSIVTARNVPGMLNIGYLISRELLGVGFEVVIRSCIDCRLKGINVKPEFWE